MPIIFLKKTEFFWNLLLHLHHRWFLFRSWEILSANFDDYWYLFGRKSTLFSPNSSRDLLIWIMSKKLTLKIKSMPDFEEINFKWNQKGNDHSIHSTHHLRVPVYEVWIHWKMSSLKSGSGVLAHETHKSYRSIENLSHNFKAQ